MPRNVGQPASLTDEQVRYIRENLNDHNLYDLAKRFLVSHITIRNAVKGNPPYDQILDPPPIKKWIRQKPRSKKLTKKFISEVKAMRKEVGLNRPVAEHFNISIPYVSRICNGHYDD